MSRVETQAEMQVRAGQVWADNDWRSTGRTLQVIRTNETHALCEVLTDSRVSIRSSIGRTTRISLKRFKPTSTGYRLLPAIQHTPDAAS